MLIGIVKKNAIMQIDFALAAERNEGKNSGAGHSRRLPHPLPPHPDDLHGGHARSAPMASATAPAAKHGDPLGVAVVGGLIVLAADHALSHARCLYLHGRFAI